MTDKHWHICPVLTEPWDEALTLILEGGIYNTGTPTESAQDRFAIQQTLSLHRICILDTTLKKGTLFINNAEEKKRAAFFLFYSLLSKGTLEIC